MLTPTAEGEIYAIVTHRLFQKVDCAAAKETYGAYMAYYAALVAERRRPAAALPAGRVCRRDGCAYPFHPELVTVLNRKTATIPNFNQTRGALRLLAWAVRQLVGRASADAWLIHPYHLDLAQPQIVEDLTSRLDRPKFRQVIEADIASPLMGTSRTRRKSISRWSSAQAALCAAPGHDDLPAQLDPGHRLGVDPADLLLATVQPDGGDAASLGGGDRPPW